MYRPAFIRPSMLTPVSMPMEFSMYTTSSVATLPDAPVDQRTYKNVKNSARPIAKQRMNKVARPLQQKDNIRPLQEER
jgi:hypothetical protein